MLGVNHLQGIYQLEASVDKLINALTISPNAPHLDTVYAVLTI